MPDPTTIVAPDAAALPAKESTPAPEQAKAAEVDYKAEYTRLLEENTKLQNDFKAQSTGRMKQDERDARMQDILDEQKANRLAMKAIAEAMNKGDFQELPMQMATIEAETTQKQQFTQSEARATVFWQKLENAVKDEDGKPLLDLWKAPELEGVRKMWAAAYAPGKTYDFPGMAEAVSDAVLATRKADRAHAAAAVKAAKDEGKAKLAAADVNNLDTGPGAGMSGESYEVLQGVDLRGKSPKWLTEHNKKLDAAYAAMRR